MQECRSAPKTDSKLYPIGKRCCRREAARLEYERDQLETSDQDPDRRYILELEIAALREESTRMGSRIAYMLERDLQRCSVNYWLFA